MGLDLIAGALISWAALIAMIDARTLRIPNLLLVLVAVPALAAPLVNGAGLTGTPFGSSLIGFLLALILTGAGYLRRQVGAGDVKYACLLGWIVGFPMVLKLLLCAALAIGILSLAASALTKWGAVTVSKVPAGVGLGVGFVAVLVGSY